MNTARLKSQRRDFLKYCGLSGLPLFLPQLGTAQTSEPPPLFDKKDVKSPVNFLYDGLSFTPQAYLDQLKLIDQDKPLQGDFYGVGGATKALEETFAKLTGKEKAIYLPTGTMANQLAIKLLNGSKTKVIVPENSHIFRDEADAAQSVHQKRLIPVGKEKAFFDLDDLKATLNYLDQNEVFKSGLGTVVIENPVRRADGKFVPLETIKSIATYCRAEGYQLHLDGARIHLAAAYSGVSVKDYASYFDTVYISLYKYLNAAGGAILCGDAQIIDQLSHQIKIYGGTTYQTWTNTAMALHYLEGIDQRWKKVVAQAGLLMAAINQLEGLSVSALEQGTNIHHLKVAKSISLKALANHLYEEHNIWLGRANAEGIVRFTINESLLSRDLDSIINAWKAGWKIAQKS